MTEQRLQLLFSEFNLKYFSGLLIGWQVSLVNDEDADQGTCFLRRRLIHVNEYGADDTDLQKVLLHEMAHAITNAGHDEPFKNAVEQLKRRGAPVGELEEHLQPFRRLAVE